MSKFIVVFASISIIVAFIVVLKNHVRTKRTMDTLEKMIDSAADGEYSETKFDESRLSALETKFSNYLSSSSTSSKNIMKEKEKIKTLISDISHQTKTPISNLILYSELIEEGDLSEDMRSNVEAIKQQAEKLEFLIKSLVKLSRLENGILNLSPIKEEIQPMLQDIYEQYISKAIGKNLELNIEKTTSKATFDRKWTTEALGNIVDNAIKYTNSGEINIKVHEYEIFTRIDISDTGIGISESEQAEVFSRFYRSQSVHNDEGVGIGLYLTREIISSEGGYIKLTSELGVGSTFSVYIPR
ncbi:sensor histidine kinase [Peptacetobacter hiranonis]|uniref:histidine kinase n=1 Tax=Peptacetobacter hiranonis (strain DSM 13275 / JCM 10541 / KCTC 15199 / TO-931) TaxID=500633 RepID=B6FXR4_PEPHT|nr:HAMP domain-containing sensor histidine kinase [Peptacetobacter hiranonis]EEA85678.1 ATPase/histidine kinase/DNA gyrase B/HSP90 domain protein [Peptacetobacter hiranonis DSM 13275]QEK19964.1 Sensor histidine kinase ResE [Peptacetobacter hiranonis]